MQMARTAWFLAAFVACCGCREAGFPVAGGPIRLATPAVRPTVTPVSQPTARRAPAVVTPRIADKETSKLTAGMSLVGSLLRPPIDEPDESNGRDESLPRPVTQTIAVMEGGTEAGLEKGKVGLPGRVLPTSAVSLLTDLSDAPQPTAQDDPAYPLTLDSAIATALNRNPDLVAMRAADPVASAAYGVAETYPWNPFVQVEVLPYARDASGDSQGTVNYVLLMQTLELAHQGRYRKAGAAAALNQVRWNIVQAELTNTALTEQLFFAALYQRDLRDLAERAASLNEDLLGVVERRFNAALATSAELTTMRVTARQSRKQAGLAETNFQTALLALERQMNMPTSQTLTLIGRLEDFAWLPVAGVESTAAGPIQVSTEVTWQFASQRPDVLAAQSGASAAQSAAGLAQANRVPNVQIGPFYEQDEAGTVFAGFRSQMDLPVWNTGRPLAQQRDAEARQQRITTQQLRSRAQVEIQTAVERYERARRLVERERERADFADAEPDELERMRDLFEAGEADILAVFATQTSLLQEQRTYLDLLNELAQAAADVTRAAGLPPARLVLGNHAPTPAPPASAPEG